MLPTQAAIDLLEVAWKINEELQENPFAWVQLVALITKRYINGTMRK